MDINWTHAVPTVLAVFVASLVEFIEALTIVLAVGAVRGWRGAIGGAALALVSLLLLVVVLGPAITQIPQGYVQLVLGTLLLLFGLRWLRKAVLRAAGSCPSSGSGLVGGLLVVVVETQSAVAFAPRPSFRRSRRHSPRGKRYPARR
jgi:uncharacterized membrane protein